MYRTISLFFICAIRYLFSLISHCLFYIEFVTGGSVCPAGQAMATFYYSSLGLRH